MTAILLLLAGAFLLGSFPTAYVVARKKGIDIRKHGSGNIGATNALRVLGKKYGALVFLADFLKGAVPAGAGALLFAGDPQAPMIALTAGVAAMFGHIFTPFLGFKGGKGVSTGAGALCAAYPLLFVLSFAVFLLMIFSTKIVSLSALTAMGVLVPVSLWYPKDPLTTGLLASIFLLVCWTHRENIGRLCRGEEGKITPKNA